MKRFFKKLFNKRIMISLVILIVLSSVTGYFAAQFYIDRFMIEVQAVTESEERVRDNANTVIARNKGKSPDEVSPTDNFIIAEYNVNQKTSVKKTTTGTVTAAGIKQSLYSEKIFQDGQYYSMKISSGLVSLATRFYYTIGDETIAFYSGTDIQAESAKFPAEPNELYTLEEYKAMYGSPISYFVNYIVSSNTVKEEEFLGKTENDTYKFKVKLDTAFSVMNYSFEIKTTSGSSKLPRFNSIELTFEIDENFNFYEINIVENYDVSIQQLGSMYVGTTGALTEKFEYDGSFEIPRS